MGNVVTVDIGNTNIVVGLWDNDELTDTSRIQTKRDYTEDELEKEIRVCVGEIAFEGGILSSVVPEITDKALNAIEKITGKRPLLMGPFLHTGVDVSFYGKEKETGTERIKSGQSRLGVDRIVDISAASAMNQGRPVMTCDLGSCTTITVADSDGRIIGGMIAAGIQMSLDAEVMRTSQLPQLEAGKASSILGNDTASNMMSGAVAGTGLMISAAADRIEKEYGLKDMALVLTGGLGKLVLPWIEHTVVYEPDLLLKGLYEIYKMNSGN